ncbi:hypothetical protein [Thermasporomyces composti]|nr:hypothetical protein [Thermasporomyces composti]
MGVDTEDDEGNAVRWLRRVFNGKDDLAPPPPLTLDVDRRREQLARLEQALDRLVDAMRANEARMSNPAWRERMSEYRRLSGETYRLRTGTFTREQILDLVFEVRPVFSGDLPEDVQVLSPLQDELLAAAAALQEVLPGERPSESA